MAESRRLLPGRLSSLSRFGSFALLKESYQQPSTKPPDKRQQFGWPESSSELPLLGTITRPRYSRRVTNAQAEWPERDHAAGPDPSSGPGEQPPP